MRKRMKMMTKKRRRRMRALMKRWSMPRRTRRRAPKRFARQCFPSSSALMLPSDPGSLLYSASFIAG
jgi:hypothetical protein